VNLMKFSKDKCKVLHMGRGNPKHKYRRSGEWIKSNPKEKDLAVLVHKQLNMRCQCVLTTQKAKHILGCVKSSVASRSRQGILPPCSTLVRAHLESCVQFWSPHHGTDMEWLE